MKKVFVINGSASVDSSNKKVIENVIELTESSLSYIVFDGLKSLPHFNPELSVNNTPNEILNFRKEIENADGILFCTPEYIFSIPSGLKNALEWCVSTTVFSQKPVGIITASANGEEGHAELQLILKTLMANFTSETTLLIQGVKGKFDQEGKIVDKKTSADLERFAESFKKMLDKE